MLARICNPCPCGCSIVIRALQKLPFLARIANPRQRWMGLHFRHGLQIRAIDFNHPYMNWPTFANDAFGLTQHTGIF